MTHHTETNRRTGAIPHPTGEFGVPLVSDGTPPKDSLALIERWRKAPARIDSYLAGSVIMKDGSKYRYPKGNRLVITPTPNEEVQVMDTSEWLWASEIVEAAFNAESIRRLPQNFKLKVLERGAGLMIVGSRIIDHLMRRRSGEYHIIELNKEVLHNPIWGVYAWRQKQMDRIAEISREKGIPYDIDIIVHEGDAIEETQKLVDSGKKFIIIIGDTVPLKPSDSGVNDIVDIDVTKRALNRGGVLGFFAWDPQHLVEQGALTARQLGILQPHFSQIQISSADIKPPPSYTYLFGVRSLPVVTCIKT